MDILCNYLPGIYDLTVARLGTTRNTSAVLTEFEVYTDMFHFYMVEIME